MGWTLFQFNEDIVVVSQLERSAMQVGTTWQARQVISCHGAIGYAALDKARSHLLSSTRIIEFKIFLTIPKICSHFSLRNSLFPPRHQELNMPLVAQTPMASSLSQSACSFSFSFSSPCLRACASTQKQL